MNVSPEQKEILEQYAKAVVEAPISLTATRDVTEFWNRHILDAMTLLDVLMENIPVPDRPRILDVGTGNGVPGLVWAILNPLWPIMLLDSSNKKCLFIDSFCKSHNIKNVQIIPHRAEEIARQPAHRQQYDIVVGRALSKLPTALEYCAAFAKTEGHVIVPHGTSWSDELARSQSAMKLLGLSVEKNVRYQAGDHGFQMLMFKKNIDTDPRYPRATGIPEKRPL